MKKLASLSIRLNVVMLIIYCSCFQSFQNFENGEEIVDSMELTKEILIREEWRQEERIYNMSGKIPAMKSYLKYIDFGEDLLADFENRIDFFLSKNADSQEDTMIDIVEEYHQILWYLRNTIYSVLSDKEVMKRAKFTQEEFIERKKHMENNYFLNPFLEKHMEDLEDISSSILELILKGLQLDLRQMYHCGLDQLGMTFSSRDIFLTNAFPMIIPHQHLLYDGEIVRENIVLDTHHMDDKTIQEFKELNQRTGLRGGIGCALRWLPRKFKSSVVLGNYLPYEASKNIILSVNGNRVELDQFGRGVFIEKASYGGCRKLVMRINPQIGGGITGRKFYGGTSYEYCVHYAKQNKS